MTPPSSRGSYNNKIGACSSRVLELPDDVETHRELPQGSNREPIVHKSFTSYVTLTDYNSRTKRERNTKLGMHSEITSAYHPQVRPAITEGVHM